MGSELEKWARAERDFLRDEIKWFKAGGRILSPSNEDITAAKLEQLEARLEHVLSALAV